MDGVSKKVNYLVCGEQDLFVLAPGQILSSKARKAQGLRVKGYDIQMISERDFLRLL